MKAATIKLKRCLMQLDSLLKKLRREQFGNIDVAGLAAGEFRPLTPHEVKTLISMANDKKEKPKLRFTKMRQFKKRAISDH